jgi:HEAT repeat protein
LPKLEDGAPVFELVQPGTMPRETLRYRPVKGQSVLVDMTLRTSALTMLGNLQQAYQMVMEFTTIQTYEDGRFQQRMKVLQAKALANQSADASGATIPGIEKLVGCRSWDILDSRGIVQSSDFRLANSPDDPTLKPMLDALLQAVQQVYMPLPVEPVGAGAQWKMSIARQLKPLQVSFIQTWLITFVKRQGEQLFFRVRAGATAQPQSVQLPGALAQTPASLTKYVIDSDLFHTASLTGLSFHAKATNRSQMAVSVYLSGNPQAMETSTTFSFDMKSRPAPSAQPRAPSTQPSRAANEHIQQLLRELAHPDFFQAHKTITALGKLGSAASPAVPRLMVFMGNGNQIIRRITAETLGKIGPAAAQAIPTLIQALRDPELAVRWQSADSLGKIGKSAIPELIKAMGHDDVLLRRYSVRALGNILPTATAEITPHLIKTMADSEADVREAAASALSNLPEPVTPAIQALTRAMQDRNPEVRVRAEWSLCTINSFVPRSLPLLVGGLEDRNAQFRMHAASLLAHLGPKAVAATPALGKALNDSDEQVRSHAAFALYKVSGSVEIPLKTLIFVANHGKDFITKIIAIMAIGNMGRDAASAIPHLLHASKNDPSVQSTVEDAIKKIRLP